MGFRETQLNSTTREELEQALRELYDFASYYEEGYQPDEEPADTVEELLEDEEVELPDTTIEKLGVVVNKILDQIITGELVIENAVELTQTIEAVRYYESLANAK